MIRPRTALAVGLAGLCTAALGGGVLSAEADLRTFQLTLADGRIVTQTVDVPAGLDLWAIDFPDVNEDDIVSIAELPPPKPPPQPKPEPQVESEAPPTAAEEPKLAPEDEGSGKKEREQPETGAAEKPASGAGGGDGEAKAPSYDGPEGGDGDGDGDERRRDRVLRQFEAGLVA